MHRALCCILLLLFSAELFAGTLKLKNGDVLQGKFVSIDGDTLTWQHDVLGELKIKKSQVANLKSAARLKVRGEKEPCSWRALVNEKVIFDCGPKHKVVSFMSVKQLVLYSGHSQAIYSYGGSLRASGWKQSGNTETENWELVTETKLRHSDLRHNFIISANGQSVRDKNLDTGEVVETSTQRELFSYALDWFFLPQFYWSNKISAESDDNRNIQEEYALSSGLGYQFWETDASAFSIESGLEYSRFYLNENPAPNEPEETTSLRFASAYRYKFHSGLKLYHNNEFTRALDKPADGGEERWEFRTDSGVAFPIGFGISADLGINWKFVNHAKDLNPNASRIDSTYRVGVNYAW